jgi:hypothetical protein
MIRSTTYTEQIFFRPGQISRKPRPKLDAFEDFYAPRRWPEGVADVDSVWIWGPLRGIWAH